LLVGLQTEFTLCETFAHIGRTHYAEVD
jgi:hypothetical protein